MRKIVILLSVLVALVAFFSLGLAQDSAKTEAKAAAKEVKEVKHDYVGVTKCKGCHKAQFEAWSETPHAKAWEALSAEEQKKPECATCHETGKTAGETAEMLTGVQCEACHGGGADYKSFKIMNKKKWAADPEGQLKLAQAAGLIIPTADDCMRCHKKEGNPNFKPFDFEKMKDKVHPVKAEG